MIKGCLLVLLLMLGAPSLAYAQANIADPTASPDLCAQYPGDLSPEDLAAYKASCMPARSDHKIAAKSSFSPCGNFGIADAELARQLQQACVEDIKNTFAYAADLRRHNVALYRWQASASDDMRILVWVVVLAGIGMAIYQLVIIMQIELWRARRRPSKAAADPAAPPGIPPQQLELGLGKVQVTSSIVGVVVLVISIAFLYLYVTEVYSIKPPV
nr:hypothetical protein [uncultured Dongia sp.]